MSCTVTVAWMCVVPVNQTLDPTVAVLILQQCTAGLNHLHTLGIIHRDFRAANVLVASRDPFQVVVADLGLSHLLRKYDPEASAGAGLVRPGCM